MIYSQQKRDERLQHLARAFYLLLVSDMHLWRNWITQRPSKSWIEDSSSSRCVRKKVNHYLLYLVVYSVLIVLVYYLVPALLLTFFLASCGSLWHVKENHFTPFAKRSKAQHFDCCISFVQIKHGVLIILSSAHMVR